MVKFNDSYRKILLNLALISIIFSIGIFLRLETVNFDDLNNQTFTNNDKSFYLDHNGLPYMYEMDSYYNYRLTRNFIQHGYLGDIKVNGSDFDLHSYFPPGRSASYPPLIVYITAFFYYLVNFFFDVPLLLICFWIPAIIAPLAGIVAYFFVKRFTNTYGAFSAGILTVTVPYYFVRSVPGFFDTDMFNILFPLLIMWSLAEASNAKTYKNLVYFTLLAALATAMFSIAWQGWIYIFYVIISAFLVYYLLVKVLKKSINNTWHIFYLYIIFCIIFVLLFNYSTSLEIFSIPFTVFNSGSNSSWPNFFVSVSELARPEFEKIIIGLGISFFLGIMGVFWIFRVLINKKLKKTYLNKMNWFLYTILVVSIVLGFFAVNNGVRYIIVFLPPMIICSGIMVGIVIEYLEVIVKIKKAGSMRNKLLIKSFSIAIILLICIPAVFNVYDRNLQDAPMANDDLWQVSTWVKDNTKDNTVVISEWSYGHFFAAFSDRPVSIDGGSQNSQRNYWIYKAFSTNNDSLSLGIFRMLSNSGDSAFTTIDGYTHNTTKSVIIMNNILGVNKTVAVNILLYDYNFTKSQSDNIVRFTHPSNSAPFVVITHPGMINTGYWFFYFGDWDFKTKKGGNHLYSHGTADINGSKLNSTNGVEMDLKTGKTTLNGIKPYCVTLIKNNAINRHYIDKNSDFCVFIIDYKTVVVIDKRFENSVFTKLVLEKSNSTVFKPLYSNKSVVVWGIQA